MGNGDQAAPQAGGFHMTPEFMGALAELIGDAMNKLPPVKTGQADVADAAKGTTPTPAQTGEALGTALAPLAAPILAKAESKLKSRKLWVAIGTIAPLLAQSPMGLALPPAAQVAIAALAAVYVAAQAIVDSTGKGGSHG